MSGGKAKRRAQQKWRRDYAFKIRHDASVCSNCGDKGPHFVPPSFGEPGFYMCTKPATNGLTP